ncbi:MAG: hypothetical protein IKJ19_04680 [Clostridia bacterium]|nr:hypothetical protein [Clostridia bacterium]
MTDKRVYTTNELENMSIYDLRLLLRSLGGVPKSKKGREMINEIIDIQMGNKTAQKNSNRGRKPKNSINEDAIPTTAEPKERFSSLLGGGRAFTEQDLNSNNYYIDGVSVPVSVEVADSGCVLGNIILASGILFFANDEGYLCDISNVANPLYFYVEKAIISRYDLKEGDKIIGSALFSAVEGYYSLIDVIKINGYSVDNFRRNKEFERLNAIQPNQSLISNDESNKTLRTLEFYAPIGIGSRSLIVAQPKTGVTDMIKDIAKSIKLQNNNLKLFCILVDEKPEDVTEFSSILNENELFSFSYDDGSIQRIKLLDLILKSAKRLVECGEKVIILLNSLTKLTQAYYSQIILCENQTESAEHRAIIETKKFFLSGRNTREGGSLTIIASLLDGDSDLDKALSSQLLPASNTQIYLSANLAKKRIYPAIDLDRSVADYEEKLLSEERYKISLRLKSLLAENVRANEVYNQMINSTKDNDEFCKNFDEWEIALK